MIFASSPPVLMGWFVGGDCANLWWLGWLGRRRPGGGGFRAREFFWVKGGCSGRVGVERGKVLVIEGLGIGKSKSCSWFSTCLHS